MPVADRDADGYGNRDSDANRDSYGNTDRYTNRDADDYAFTVSVRHAGQQHHRLLDDLALPDGWCD